MKKLFFLTILVSAILFAGRTQAADTTLVYTVDVGTVTLDSAWDIAWEVIDSLIVTSGTVAPTVLNISGIAVLDPGDLFWIGFCNDSISLVDSLAYAASRNLDSALVKGLGRWSRGRLYLPFSISTIDSMTAAQVDTFYFVGACGGSAGIEKVILNNVIITATTGSNRYP